MEQYQQTNKDTQQHAIAAIAGNLAGSSRMDALGALGYFYLKNRQAQKALVLFTALGRLLPGDHRITLSLAYAHYMTADYQNALALSRQVLDQASSMRSAARILHSRILIKLGRNNEARQLMRPAKTTEEIL